MTIDDTVVDVGGPMPRAPASLLVAAEGRPVLIEQSVDETRVSSGAVVVVVDM